MHDAALGKLVAGLVRAKSPEDYHAALRHVLAAYDQLNETTIREKDIYLDCCEGCALCCMSFRVDVRAPEVFLMADHIRRHFTPEEIRDLIDRLTVHAKKVIAMTPYEHVTQNVQCPMLKDGRCSVYVARPHTCRRHHSQDFDACQFTYDHPEDLEFPGAHHKELYYTLGIAMQDAASIYGDHGFDNTIYELGSALLEALSNPATWRRWRDGKKAFLKASITPAG